MPIRASTTPAANHPSKDQFMQADQHPNHMTPDEFKQAGYRMVDTITEYMRTVESMPVTPKTKPGDVLDALPISPPENPESWDAIHTDLDSIITPNLTHWQHPGFFAYFSCNASAPAILAEIAAAGLNVNGMLWSTSPAATELETRMLDWCAQLFDLPKAFISNHQNNLGRRGGGVIQSTASEATLVALLAAQERHRDLNNPQTGVLVTSDQAHSSVIKAAMIAGLAQGPDDQSRVRLVRTHPDGSMNLDELARTIDAIHAENKSIIMLSATAGTTGTGGIDDTPAVRDTLDRAHETGHWPGWLHLDAAWAGVAAVCPEHRGVLAGARVADSVCINPHKWLLTNFDCDLMWTRDSGAIIRALSITPEYLRNKQSDANAVIDYRDWQIPLGRRFRALKLWFVIRHYGLQGLRAHIRCHLEWAEWFAQQAQADDRFELICPRSLGLVCFRLKHAPDAHDPNPALLESINQSGKVFLSHTAAPKDGRFTIRFVTGATATEFKHVAGAWSIIKDAASSLANLG